MSHQASTLYPTLSSVPDSALRSNSDLQLILEMAKLQERRLDPDSIIVAMLRLLAQMRGLNGGRVSVPDPSGVYLEVRHSYGLDAHHMTAGGYTVPLNQGVTGYVMRTGTIGLVADIQSEPIYLTRITSWDERYLGPIAFLAVPILAEGRPIAVLAAQKDGAHRHRFDDDLMLMRIAAAMIGQIMRIERFVSQRTADLVTENQQLWRSIRQNGLAHGIIGESTVLLEALKQAGQVARSEAPVILLGESGTGKEKFARLIHQQSDRRERPFICINCAAIPAALLESELFGHEKGSFTGADATRKGKIEAAEGGTLFLDEIGDMPLELQAKLLRVLQDRQVQRVGASQVIPVDFRILTATNVNLRQLVNERRFRLDLYYRLSVVPIYLPPLRERNGDIKILALHFLNELNHRYERNVTLENGVLRRLESFDWPGNIRQLQNVMERAIVMAEGLIVTATQIALILQDESTVQLHQPDQTSTDVLLSAPHGLSADCEPRHYLKVHHTQGHAIEKALRDSGGNQSAAARRLGMTTRQLRYRMSKLGIDAL
ncbi:GAF domain-containing protein [Candidatus Macondimonas diazotrophica]|jgi:Nif-specific regulatory protein|nr:GAF domain-containing protein [Candidatus Macondimonas diazotrophica]HBG50587.1 nitrogen fixation protein NifA [Gammaproteobacteria bacterium]